MCSQTNIMFVYEHFAHSANVRVHTHNYSSATTMHSCDPLIISILSEWKTWWLFWRYLETLESKFWSLNWTDSCFQKLSIVSPKGFHSVHTMIHTYWIISSLCRYTVYVHWKLSWISTPPEMNVTQFESIRNPHHSLSSIRRYGKRQLKKICLCHIDIS